MSIQTALYPISQVVPARDEHLNQGTFLVLLHARQAPPHIYLSISGNIFSLGIKGPSIDGRMDQMLRFIHGRRVETLFLELLLPPLASVRELLDRVREIILGYGRVDAGTTTCLTPVRDFCDELYGTGTRQVNLIFDLLPRLQERKALGSISHINLGAYLREGVFHMQRYAVADIYESIHRARSQVAAI